MFIFALFAIANNLWQRLPEPLKIQSILLYYKNSDLKLGLLLPNLKKKKEEKNHIPASFVANYGHQTKFWPVRKRHTFLFYILSPTA